MYSAESRPRLLMLLFAPVFLLYGVLGSAEGFTTLQEWSATGTALKAFGIFWMVCGPVMLVSTLWLLGSLGRNRWWIKTGGMTAVFFGALQILGSLSQIVPCGSPG